MRTPRRIANSWNALVGLPTLLRSRLLKLIERERRRAEAGQTAEIRAKMNSLVDPEIIRALYEASRAGVHIRLNVRGMCTLRPGVKGLSDTISVFEPLGELQAPGKKTSH